MAQPTEITMSPMHSPSSRLNWTRSEVPRLLTARREQLELGAPE